MKLLLYLLIGCSLGEAFVVEEFIASEIIIFNPTHLSSGTKPSLEWAAAWKNGSTLTANRYFGLRLSFDKYDEYFYPNGEGRESKYGHYQVIWKVSRVGIEENLLLTGSSDAHVYENKFVQLDAEKLNISTSQTLTNKALIFLKIIASSPPYLPTGDYIINAEINDGEAGSPKTLTQFNRTIFYQEPLNFYDGEVLTFHSHTASNNYQLAKASVVEELTMQNQQLQGTLKQLAQLTTSYLILEGFQKHQHGQEKVLFSLDAANTANANIVKLSEAEQANAQVQDSTQFYSSDSFAMQIRITAAAQVLLFRIKLTDEYAQESTIIPVRLSIS